MRYVSIATVIALLIGYVLGIKMPGLGAKVGL